MPTQMEWKRRIDRFIEQLESRLFTPLGDVDLAMARTFDEIPLEACDGLDFGPAPVGTPWGLQWEYAWFRGRLALPDGPIPPDLALRPGTGPDSVVYVDGHPCGALDRFHDTVDLGWLAGDPAREADLRAGVDLRIATYAGHGERNGHVGPVPPDTVTVRPVTGPQRTVGPSRLGRFHEDRYQLLVDVRTLREAHDTLPKETLRSEDLFGALCTFTMTVDLELDGDDLDESCRACRAALAPVFACRNGSTSPLLTVFGHSHLDVAWKWPLAETRRKMERTLSNQFALLDRYPEYRYFQSQPYLLDMVKVHFPALYERFRAEVLAGRIFPEGGMYVESDTNLPCGESLVRQFLAGRRFLREEFGVESRLCWLPDVFGYSGALPQILAGCGIEAFTTSKLLWAYNGGDPFPYVDFLWEGIDGTRIPAHNHNEYNSHTSPGFLVRAFSERVQKPGVRGRLVPFGYGDGGGGATRDHLEYLRRMGDFEGVPRTRMAHPMTYFDELAVSGRQREIYRGELYFQAHRGTYTSQSETKTANRKAEEALLAAELWLSADRVLQGRIPPECLEQAWKDTLVAQFHDILPGSSIGRVHREAVASLEAVRTCCDTVRHRVGADLGQAVPPGTTLLLLNPLPQERTEWVEWPEGSRQYRRVTVPSAGYRAIGIGPEADPVVPTVLAAPDRLENECLSIRLSLQGELLDIVDRATGRRWNAGPCNRLRLYRDTPSLFDAWDIDSQYEDEEESLGEDIDPAVVLSGGPVGEVAFTRRFGSSRLTQVVRLRAGEHHVEFDCRLDWQERHRLLKVEFAPDLRAMEGISEIQYGWIRRPNDRSTQYGKDRFEVCQQRWSALCDGGRGMAVLNDCRQGLSFHDNVLRLTLQKGAMAPDMDADRGTHRFRYALAFWEGPLDGAALSRMALAFAVPLDRVPDRSAPAWSLLEMRPDPSDGAGRDCGLLVDAVKLADDGSGDLVVRMHEARGTRSRGCLKLNFPVGAAVWTNLVERPIDRPGSQSGDAGVRPDGTLPLELGAFEIRTLRIRPGA